MSSSSFACTAVIIAVVSVVVAIIALIATSLAKLASDEVGIQYNVINKRLGDEAHYEGLHSGPPGFTFIKYPSTFKTLNFNLMCLNHDGVETQLDISFQYRVRGNFLKDIILQFSEHENFLKALDNIGQSAIHDACSKFNTTQFQSERGAFQEDLRGRLVNKFDSVQTDITDLQVNNINRPYAYENAVRRKETAREDITVAVQERPRKMTEAGTVRLEAETYAEITLNRAYSDARIKETTAEATAQGILNDYSTEAESYASLVAGDGLNLNPEGFLAYMGVRVIEEAQSPVNVAMDAPAKTAYLASTTA